MGDNGDGRNDEIWTLAQAGLSQAEIAAKFGISRQRVSQIVADRTPATWGFTDRDRAQIRARETAVLERMARKIEEVIASPPLMHSAIGKAIEDPRNPGTYLINESVRVGAIRERRLLSESYRRLTGADLAASARTGEEEARAAAHAHIAQLAAARQAERDEMDHLRAQLAERDRALAALPQPGDDQITDAELVDDTS